MEKLIEKYIPEIIRNFYQTCKIHMRQKIIGFYSMSDDDDEISSVTIEGYKKLRELKDIIYNKELFSIDELRKKMKFYPGKYLNILQNKAINIESPLSQEIQSYQIKYSNYCSYS